MNKNKHLAICLAMAFVPAAAMAQTNIKRAFADFVSGNEEYISAKHSLEKDPETGRKEAQYDIYDFTIPKAKRRFVKDVETAFDKDREEAYSVNSGTSDGRSYTYVSLAVGDGKGSGVAIGKMPNAKYIYSCFMDKDDATKKYRYAYAMEWREDSKEIKGRLVVTYATTLKYRRGQSKDRVTIIEGFGREEDTGAWLGEFNVYKNMYKSKDGKDVESIYAPEIYNLCKKPVRLSEAEKKLVIDELKKMKALTKDSFNIQLFDASIERIGK